MSLRVLSGRTPACLVEVYLAHTKECSSRSDVIELVEMTSDGVWEWFPSLNYEFMSKRFWSILGYDHREMSSSPDGEAATRPLYLSLVLEAVKACISLANLMHLSPENDRRKGSFPKTI